MNSNQYLAEEKISTLMLKFSVPCIMSLMVSSLYNIVDQIFIGRGVGYLGNGATNVVFPITIIALALALLIGDACAAFLSLSLLRDFIVSVPAILILPLFGGVEAVLWSASIADVISIVAAALMVRHIWNHQLKEEKQEPEYTVQMSFAEIQQA